MERSELCQYGIGSLLAARVVSQIPAVQGFVPSKKVEDLGRNASSYDFCF